MVPSTHLVGFGGYCIFCMVQKKSKLNHAKSRVETKTPNFDYIAVPFHGTVYNEHMVGVDEWMERTDRYTSVINTKYKLSVIWHSLYKNLGIIDLQCCNHRYLLSVFLSKFQPSMMIFHRTNVRRNYKPNSVPRIGILMN